MNGERGEWWGGGVYDVEDVAQALWHESHVGRLPPHQEEESDVNHVSTVAVTPAAVAVASALTPGGRSGGEWDTEVHIQEAALEYETDKWLHTSRLAA